MGRMNWRVKVERPGVCMQTTLNMHVSSLGDEVRSEPGRNPSSCHNYSQERPEIYESWKSRDHVRCTYAIALGLLIWKKPNYVLPDKT